MNYHLDFETRSRVDLKVVGAYRYAEDKSTEILMFGIASDVEGPYLWVHPKFRHAMSSDPRADRLVRAAVASRDPIWAYYATFEVAVTRYCWPANLPRPALQQWRCVAVLGRCAAMPGRLDLLARLLHLKEQKDPEGSRIIRLFSIPQKDGEFTNPLDQPDQFRLFGAYCLQDVRTEKGIHHKLQPFELRGALLDAWLFDLVLNDRGFPVNVKALRHAQTIIDKATAILSAEFSKITKLQPTQRAKCKAYLLKLGCNMPDMTADTIEDTLAVMPETHRAYKVLRMYSLVQFAAVKKVTVMLAMVCSDGWCRGMHKFFGAGTGRWAGSGVQPQNFKRPTIKNADTVYRLICALRSMEEIELVFGNVLDAISSCIRNFIQWMQGEMVDADYNAVEARIVNWLAGQEDALEVYRKADAWKGDPKLKPDPYKIMAAGIYDKMVINVDKDEREVGKRAELGCGFGMGPDKFQFTCWDQYRIKVSDEVSAKAVKTYRKKHNKVADYNTGLWNLCQNAATRAIQNPGSIHVAGKHLRFWVETINGIPFLCMRLPSGRKLVYPYPELNDDPKWQHPQITFYGNIKGETYGRIKTYGGKLVENATQATAFDLMAHGSVKATALGAEIVILVHDQAPSLRKKLTVEQYCAALTDLPPWAAGLPLKAEGRIVPYYKK